MARPRAASHGKTLAKWLCVGAAAGVLLALLGSQLLSSSPGSSANHAAGSGYVLPDLAGASAHPPADIKAEVPNVVGKAMPSAGSATPSEARRIESARDAVRRGDASAALAALNDYEQAHPNGALAPEAMALRIEALSNSGRTAEAEALAGDFQRKYPSHPLSAQLKNGAKPAGSTPK
jgi:TolA-binding protein